MNPVHLLRAVFWVTEGILPLYYLQTDKTINLDFYCQLLEHLDEIFVRKESFFIKTTPPLFFKYELLQHLPYSPVLALSDFFLLTHLNKLMRRKEFSSKEEVLQR